MTNARPIARPIAALALVAASTLLVAPGASSASAGAAPTCFGKRATIVGDGYLRGTSGNDVIVATGFAEVHSLGGNDRICGAALAYGGAGHDRIYYAGRGGDAELRGMGGADRVVLHGAGYLYGGQGPDVLIGGGGAQWIAGENGHDRMFGGRGRDHLFGGKGRDRADGGAGNDVCDAEKRISCHR